MELLVYQHQPQLECVQHYDRSDPSVVVRYAGNCCPSHALLDREDEEEMNQSEHDLLEMLHFWFKFFC